jgi:hypothetical protein
MVQTLTINLATLNHKVDIIMGTVADLTANAAMFKDNVASLSDTAVALDKDAMDAIALKTGSDSAGIDAALVVYNEALATLGTIETNLKATADKLVSAVAPPDVAPPAV